MRLWEEDEDIEIEMCYEHTHICPKMDCVEQDQSCPHAVPHSPEEWMTVNGEADCRKPLIEDGKVQCPACVELWLKKEDFEV
jgi:hypothetical protein